MKFSIITVALNPGKKLQETLDSIFCQTCTDYEVIVKDGGSTDGSTDRWKHDPHIRFFEEPDRGIYDAMNQAVRYAKGEFVLFLNCGDVLADKTVLERVAAIIDGESACESRSDPQGSGAAAKGGGKVRADDSCAPTGECKERLVVYGDTLSLKTNAAIASAPRITGFTCYRNIPCHQACFYNRDLFEGIRFETDYRIRADYDHFLRCVYREGAKPLYCGFTVASYEGGGYSESRENRKRDRQEHRLITREYMSESALLLYRAAMLLTLAPLRRILAESTVFSGIYQKLKKLCYKRT